MSEYINKMFEEIFNDEIIYRASGVLAFSLENAEKEQLKLFEDKKNLKSSRIADIVDKLENKYGKGSISVGSIGIKDIQSEHKRKMRYRELQ